MLGSPPRLPAYKARGSVLSYSPQQRKQSEEKQSNHLCEKTKESCKTSATSKSGARESHFSLFRMPKTDSQRQTSYDNTQNLEQF